MTARRSSLSAVRPVMPRIQAPVSMPPSHREVSRRQLRWLARKLHIAMGRFLRDGVVPEGVVLRRDNGKRSGHVAPLQSCANDAPGLHHGRIGLLAPAHCKDSSRCLAAA